MRKLFVKIFLSFWLTVLLACVAIVGLIAYSTGALGVERRALAESLLPVEAESSAQIFERSGLAALREHLDDLERRQPVQAFFFGQDGREILNQNLSSEVQQMAKMVEERDGLQLGWDRTGYRVAGPSGVGAAPQLVRDGGRRSRFLCRPHRRSCTTCRHPAGTTRRSGKSSWTRGCR